MQQKLESGIIVIFGASGDLTSRKLMPAIFNIFHQSLINKNMRVLGVARSKYSCDQFKLMVKEKLEEEFPKLLPSIDNFLENISYHSIGDYDKGDYFLLKETIGLLQDKYKLNKNLLFYIATPPELYYVIPHKIAECDMNKEGDGYYSRIIIEKPFGTDEISARKLNNYLLKYYKEKQIFRIDHYLGKETVQNILVFRFANLIFEPLWNSKYIDNVQIYVNETVGVGTRAGYYEKSGVLKDMMQNHLLQLLCMVAMEPPTKVSSFFIRNEFYNVLQAIRLFKNHNEIKNNVVLGQYTEGCIGGNIKNAYRDAKNIKKDSTTPTFAAIRFFIDNWRWSGVPFYLRTGKRMPHKVTEIVINFKNTPHPFFSKFQNVLNYKNQLVIRIQPNEGIKLTFAVKNPGIGFKSHDVDMGFSYSQINGYDMPSAYERLIVDAISGDSTLFARNDIVESCWNIIDPIIDYANTYGNEALDFYPSGTNGPAQSDNLLKKCEHEWRNPNSNFNNK